MSKLVPWETPFTESRYPSAIVITSSTQQMGAPLPLLAIVAPAGVDKYPKYLVDFGRVVAFTCMEEAYSPRNEFEVAEDENTNLCAYLFPDSPWLASYDPLRYFYSAEVVERFFHYLIFGGDNNIEVITPNVPKIRAIEQSEVLRIEHSL
ncbi:MAG: hypothetical protein JSS81_04765 [Acidobacteria bacterium]|nr:hypothetical protein [Acidobacteriota bacterium]